MNNRTTFQLKARTMLCSSLVVLLAACGGGSGTDTSQTMPSEFLKSSNANLGSNGYVSPTTTTPTTSTSTTSTATTSTATTTATTTPTTTPTTTATTTPTTTYNYYVATTGSDSNPGTQSAPFKTILKASQVAKPDTTIHVASGTYTGNFTTSSNGTASGHIFYVSDVKGGAKIVGTGTEIAWTNNGNYIEVNGFDISTSGRLGFYSAGSYGSIYNCLVHDVMLSGGDSGAGGAGIDVLGTNWSIHHNIVRNIDAARLSTRVHGIYLASANNIVSNNLISGIGGQGINTWHGATKNTIVNNTIFNARYGIVLGSGDSGQLPSGNQYNYVANNISVNNYAGGIYEQAGTTSYNTYVNNLVYNNPSNISASSTGSTVTGTVTANPLFVNYLANGAGDYHVQATSPAIDKGTLTNAPSTDLIGKARPSGAGIDIGSYEY